MVKAGKVIPVFCCPPNVIFKLPAGPENENRGKNEPSILYLDGSKLKFISGKVDLINLIPGGVVNTPLVEFQFVASVIILVSLALEYRESVDGKVSLCSISTPFSYQLLNKLEVVLGGFL